jgi:hypothetical protein
MAPRATLAADSVEMWRAASTTASSVSGDVTFAPSKIQFQNGQSLPLAVIGRVKNFQATGEAVDATVYRVTAPADLRLLNGNHLCGGGGHSQAVTYIVVWIPEAPPGGAPARSMAAFSGKDQPRSDGDPAACGTYNYELKR